MLMLLGLGSRDSDSETLSQAAKAAVYSKVVALREAIRESPCTLRLPLQPFTPEQTQAFLSVAMDGVNISAEVAQHLWEKTGGLPLYMEQVRDSEILGMLIVRGTYPCPVPAPSHMVFPSKASGDVPVRKW